VPLQACSGDAAYSADRFGSNSKPDSDGQVVKVKIRANNEIRLRIRDGLSTTITAEFLAKNIPDVTPGKMNVIKVKCVETGVTFYSCYKGGRFWYPGLPSKAPRPTTDLSMMFGTLTTGDFLNGLTPFLLTNSAGLRWMPSLVTSTKARLSADGLALGFLQSPEVEGVSSFELRGDCFCSPRSNSFGTYLEFQTFADLFDQRRVLRVYHDGLEPPRLAMKGSVGFEKIILASSDGIKLRIIASAGREFSAATLYMGDPGELYDSSEPVIGGEEYLVKGSSRTYHIDSVAVRRQIERKMLQSKSTYAHGRLGAEMAYAISKQRFGLERVILREPSTGGKDLYTRDGRYLIQARLLTDPKPLGENLRRTIKIQLNRLVRKLRQDFRYNSSATKGYAILSYLDPSSHVVNAIISEVINR
jgi:hypothetical protein